MPVGQGKGHTRRVRGLANLTIAPPEKDARWYPPDPEHTETYLVNVPIGGDGRVIGRTEFDGSNRMTEFSLTAQTLFVGYWCDVARVDTAHAKVHVHYFYRTRREEDTEVIRIVRCQNDVDKGYQAGEKLLIVNWEDNLRRWHG